MASSGPSNWHSHLMKVNSSRAGSKSTGNGASVIVVRAESWPVWRKVAARIEVERDRSSGSPSDCVAILWDN